MSPTDPLAVTNAATGRNPAEAPAGLGPEAMPREIGRYRIERLLGRGGFGRVYLAIDDRLRRQVAVKVPDPELLSHAGDVDSYLAEARTVAGLDHPHIVPVYDVGSAAGFPCFVVSRYLDGGDLVQAMHAGRVAPGASAELIASIADALHYAHTKGLVHRDIKPGNILLDAQRRAYVTDFGLALKEVHLGRGPNFAGTPAYMSPEQARGEGHRVDGRADVFSLGVVLYELLTGRRPFRAETQAELLERIVAFEPRPPRQLDDSIPRELERICLKALSKRAIERYTTARDMAEELRQALAAPPSPMPGWVGVTSPPAQYVAPGGTQAAAPANMPPPLPSNLPATAPYQPRLNAAPLNAGRSNALAYAPPHALAPDSDQTPSSHSPAPPTPVSQSHDSHDLALATVVPKGLRSFDQQDSDFFLLLLPGARDRAGLPESIRFWKVHLEAADPEEAFPVGLLYGPSGCGKSSLVKAGIVPRLAPRTVPIYLEATPATTESRLLAELQKRCPALAGHGLVEACAALRRGEGGLPGRKVVVFLDQFEQWLHAHPGQKRSVLARALRQCDGAHLQCVLMVRDDFWMSVTRFLDEVEVPLVEGTNCAAVELFSPRHARKVLAAFGAAYGALPHSHEDALEQSQRDFLRAAVEGITEGGAVMPVRLALLADMLRSRAWTIGSLAALGGASGIGAAFLEETFSAANAPPEHRYHQRAARNVLKALLYLPGGKTGIKGHTRSHAELLAISGYDRRPREFDDLLAILDGELRLITPTEQEEVAGGEWRVAGEGVASGGWRVAGEATLEGEANGGAALPTTGSVADGYAASGELLSGDKTIPEGGAFRDDEPNSPSGRIDFGEHCRGTGTRHYQLTHDYLVPTLRDWLTRKQRETRRGRAELRLEERSEIWNLQPRAEYLPPWWELTAILALTNRRLWTPPQRKLVRASLRWQAARGLLVAACLALLLAGAWEANGRIRARTLVDRLVAAETPRVPAILRELAPYRRPAGSLLRQSLQAAPTGSTAATNIQLALLDDDPSQAESLLERALVVDEAEFGVLRDALVGHSERVAGGLWAIVDDAAAEPRRRLAAAKLLAEFMRTINGPQADEWHARFRKSGPFIVNQLLETAVHGTAEFDGLLQGLKPAGADLLGALRSAYHDRQQDSSLKTIALNLAATFAADDVAALADVVLTSADPARLDEYLPRFAADRQATVAALTAEIEDDPDQSSEPDWNDTPLDPSWSAPPPKYQRMVEAAVGMLAERFAFCQTMPLDDFVEVSEGLRPAGYRPVHVRPFVQQDEVLVTAVWTRDALDWRFAHDLSAADVLKTQEELKREGYLPIDLAGYPQADFRFALLAARDAELAEIDLIIGSSTANLMNEFQDRNRRGFTVLTIQASLDEQNHHRQCQVWYKARTAATHHGSARLTPETESTFETAFRQAVLPLVDACVLPAETKPPRERYLEYIANIDELLARKSDSAAIRRNRGYWQLQLGQDDQARDDFSEVLRKEPNDALALLWRAIAQARLGQAEAARQDLSLATKLADEKPKRAAAEAFGFWKIVASTYLDAPVSLEEQIESELKAAADGPDRLLRAACVYAWCAKAFSEKDQARSAACFDRSVALFREALTIAPDAFEKPRVKNELEGLLYDVPAFQELLQQHNRRYISLQATSRDRIAFESHGLSPEDHLKRCRELAAEQCRPMSMSAGSMGAGQPLATVSVWQRPILAEERRDELALRRAHAAIALLKLDEASPVWPLFRAAADPRLRAYLIESVAKFGVEPRLLHARLNKEPDGGARQALLLALADYAPAALSDSESRRLPAELGERFRHDPDPGVHSAIGWLLEKSGRHAEVRQAQAELASAGAKPRRRWYVNGQGQTLAIVGGPVEFDMGSPYYETNKNFNEPLHRRRIGRTFAIATHEVTGEQFARFLDDHPKIRNTGHGQAGTDPRRPIGSVTWYEAAQYCRWLSEREAITEDQMFYPPVEQIKQGMPLDSDLEKTGYRLPTEAEWELACRAGTATAYNFGGTTNLAPQYAWSKETSSNRLRAVGLLKPNVWGLFDMHGNIEEWCHSRYEANLPAANAASVVDDGPPLPGTIDTLVRVMRGGEFRNPHVEMRAASRKSVFAGTRDLGNGFRVARTLSVTPIEEEK